MRPSGGDPCQHRHSRSGAHETNDGGGIADRQEQRGKPFEGKTDSPGQRQPQQGGLFAGHGQRGSEDNADDRDGDQYPVTTNDVRAPHQHAEQE
jgi:hypothetical protein